MLVWMKASVPPWLVLLAVVSTGAFPGLAQGNVERSVLQALISFEFLFRRQAEVASLSPSWATSRPRVLMTARSGKWGAYVIYCSDPATPIRTAKGLGFGWPFSSIVSRLNQNQSLKPCIEQLWCLRS